MQSSYYETNKIIEAQLKNISGFEKKKITEIMNSIQKLIDAKKEQIEFQKFKFIGDPIPAKIDVYSDDFKKSLLNDSKNFDLISLNLYKIENINDEKKTYEIEKKNLLISTITNSILKIVFLKNLYSFSIYIKNIKNSVIYLKSKSTISVIGLKNVILILSCQQLRIHNTQNSIFMLENFNCEKIVIENSSGLKMGNYNKNNNNNKLQIDDFNHPTNLKKNLNYNFLTPLEELNLYEKSKKIIFDMNDGPISPSIIDGLVNNLIKVTK